MRHLVFGLVMALLLSSSSALASQSSTMAFVTDSATIPGTLLLVNLASGQSPVPVSVGSAPFGVAANPIATMPYVYVTNRGSDDLAVVNTNDWSVVRITGIGNDPFGVAVAKDGKTIYVALEGDGKLAVVNAITLLVDRIDVGPFGSNTGPTGAAVGRDGRVCVVKRERNSGG